MGQGCARTAQLDDSLVAWRGASSLRARQNSRSQPATAEDDGGCEEECILAAAQTQKWVIYQGDQNMAIVIRLGVAHKASPIIDMEMGWGWLSGSSVQNQTLYEAAHGTL